MLTAAFQYRNTKKANKYDEATLRSKFPEFFSTPSVEPMPKERPFVSRMEAKGMRSVANPIPDDAIFGNTPKDTSMVGDTIVGVRPQVDMPQVGSDSIPTAGGGMEQPTSLVDSVVSPTDTMNVSNPIDSLFRQVQEQQAQQVQIDKASNDTIALMNEQLGDKSLLRESTSKKDISEMSDEELVRIEQSLNAKAGQ